MTPAAFDDAVRALLASDAVFVPAVCALLSVPLVHVLEANMPVASIPSDAFPCWVVEQGDGAMSPIVNDGGGGGLVIGMAEQQFASTLELALVWKEQDRAHARDQRTRLPTLVAQLFMRNPQPGGVDAWLESWSPDRGGLHPAQAWRATIRGEYITPRESP